MAHGKSLAFTIKHNGICRVIKTDLTVISDKSKQNITAVWDTGATGTCISKDVASKMGLVPIGMCHSHTASGESICSEYLVDLELPNHVIIKDVRVRDFIGGPDVEALIGMDIITMGDFAITNANQKTTVSFRMPSDYRHIDYVLAQKNNTNGKLAKEHIKKQQPAE